MNAESFKKTWRPAMGWTLVFINAAYALVICLLLLLGKFEFSDMAGFMMAQIGQMTVVGSVTAAGRSWEKRHGADGSPHAEGGEGGY